MAWFSDLPRVTVPKSDQPMRLTLIYPYYDCAKFFARQVAKWRLLPQDIRVLTNIIVVDDGSPVPALLPVDLPFRLRLFRIEVDVRWNWLAARNIGAYHADEGWLLLTDMDHVVPERTLQSLIWSYPDPSVVYLFSRREHTGAPVHPHSASYLMTREMFWRIGGYDEALSGYYGTDGEFRRRVARRAPLHLLQEELIRYEYVDDASVLRYKRKQPEDVAAQRAIAARPNDWQPKTLSFPYHEVLSCCVS